MHTSTIHTETGTVSLLASSRCIHCASAATDVNSSFILRDASSCSVVALTTDWYPEYVLDHFQNLVYNLPIFQISRKPPTSFWVSLLKTDKRTRVNTLPLSTCSRGNEQDIAAAKLTDSQCLGFRQSHLPSRKSRSAPFPCITTSSATGHCRRTWSCAHIHRMTIY